MGVCLGLYLEHWGGAFTEHYHTVYLPLHSSVSCLSGSAYTISVRGVIFASGQEVTLQEYDIINTSCPKPQAADSISERCIVGPPPWMAAL